jgi:hypothetical protein
MTDDFASDFSLNFHIDSNFYHNATKCLSYSKEGETARVVNLLRHRRSPAIHSLVIITPGMVQIYTYKAY